MKKKVKKAFVTGGFLLAGFVLWTVAVSFIDVRAIGPKGSCVGFAALNGFVHNLTGVNMTLYIITDWLGLVPFGFIAGFALMGLVQWIKRKNFLKVDFSILVLGGFYIVVMAVYALFEVMVINHRPVLIDGILEASYPSSTTMLVMTVMPVAGIELSTRIKKKVLRYSVITLIALFVAFMVTGRLVSGVHWVTDIIGSAILSTGLVMVYYGVVTIGTSKCDKVNMAC